MPELKEGSEEATGDSPRDLHGPTSRQGMEEIPGPSRSEPDRKSESGDFSPSDTEDDHEELRRHLPQGSVYVWAAKLDGANTPDAIVGWMILLAQIAAYGILLAEAGKRSAQELPQAAIAHHIVDHVGDYVTSEDVFNIYNISGADLAFASYSLKLLTSTLSSVAVTMFVVLTFAAADLRASWALIQTRTRYNIVLGSAILLSFVMMVLASMRVLFFFSNDNMAFMIGAASILFISDVDHRMWIALQTVDRRARVFWCVEAMFLSVVLLLVGILWVG